MWKEQGFDRETPEDTDVRRRSRSKGQPNEAILGLWRDEKVKCGWSELQKCFSDFSVSVWMSAIHFARANDYCTVCVTWRKEAHPV